MKINHNYFIKINDDYQVIAVKEYENNELLLNYYLQAIGGANRFYVVGMFCNQAETPQDIDEVREHIHNLYDNGYFDIDIEEIEAYNDFVEARIIALMNQEIEDNE